MVKKVTKKEDKAIESNYGLISYIIGIIAIVQAFITPAAGIILGIIGLVFSDKSKDNLKRRAKNLNLAALIIGAIFFILVIVLSFTTMGANLQ